MFHNNIVKFQKKLNKRNLLKICLQVAYSKDFCIICILFFYEKKWKYLILFKTNDCNKSFCAWVVTTNSFALNHDKSLQIHCFCVKRQTKIDFLKDVESTVVYTFLDWIALCDLDLWTEMSQNVRKRTVRHMRPVKIQISCLKRIFTGAFWIAKKCSFFIWKPKALIRLRWCRSWFEYSLSLHCRKGTFSFVAT